MVRVKVTKMEMVTEMEKRTKTNSKILQEMEMEMRDMTKMDMVKVTQRVSKRMAIVWLLLQKQHSQLCCNHQHEAQQMWSWMQTAAKKRMKKQPLTGMMMTMTKKRKKIEKTTKQSSNHDSNNNIDSMHRRSSMATPTETAVKRTAALQPRSV